MLGVVAICAAVSTLHNDTHDYAGGCHDPRLVVACSTISAGPQLLCLNNMHTALLSLFVRFCVLPSTLSLCVLRAIKVKVR